VPATLTFGARRQACRAKRYMSTCFAASRSGLTFAIVTAALSILGGRQSGLGRALDQINISFLS